MPVGSAAIRAGRAFVELFVDDKRLRKGLIGASGYLKQWGRKMSALGSDALRAGLGLAAPLALATKVFAGFDDQMKAVQAVSGATGREFERLTEQAKELGRTTSYTAAEVGSAMLNLARAGFKPAEIEAATPAMLDLARATGTDLAQSADIAAGTLRAFNLEADQTTRVADVLVATANNSAQTLEDLGEAMKYAAPVAQEYGLSVEQTAKALGVMANMQIKGSMAGTSLRQMMLRLADPSVQATLKGLGIEATDAQSNLRPIGDLMAEIGQAIAQMPSGERLRLMQEMFDMRAMSGALKLARTDFPQLSKAIDEAGGTAARTAEIMDSGLGGGLRRLWSAVEGVAIAIGEALGQELTELSDKLAAHAQDIARWVQQHQQAILTVAKAAAGLLALGVALKIVGGVLGTGGMLLKGLSTLVTLLASPGLAAGAGLVVAVGLLVNEFRKLKGITAEANAELAAYQQQTDALMQKMKDAPTRVGQLEAKIELLEQMAARIRRDRLSGTMDQRQIEESRYQLQQVEGRLAKARRELERARKEQEAAQEAQTQRTAENAAVEERTRYAASLRERLDERLHQLRLEQIEDEEARAVAAIEHQYAKMREEARKAGAGLAEIDEAQIEELRGVEERFRRQREQEEERAAQERARYSEDLNHEIARARIEATLKGAERERALLKLEEERMRREARELGLDEGKVGELFDLRRMALETDQLAQRVSTVGTFNPMALWGLGGRGPMERTAQATEQTAKNTQRLVQEAKHGGLVFA